MKEHFLRMDGPLELPRDAIDAPAKSGPTNANRLTFVSPFSAAQISDRPHQQCYVFSVDRRFEYAGAAGVGYPRSRAHLPDLVFSHSTT